MIRSMSDDNGQGPPREPTLTERALLASQADVSRLTAEIAEAKRKMSLCRPTFRCGDMPNGQNAGDQVRHCGGVDVSLHENDDDAPMGFRCYDCKTVFCRACAPLHFTEEFRAIRAAVSRLSAEVAGLRERNELLVARATTEINGWQATVRVHEHTIRSVSGQRDRAVEAVRVAEREMEGVREALAPLGTAPNGTHSGTCRAPIMTCDAMDDGCHGHIARRALSTPTGTAAVPLLVQVGIGNGSWMAVGDPLLHPDNAVSFIGTAGRRFKTKLGNWRSNYPPPLATGAEVISGIFDPEGRPTS